MDDSNNITFEVVGYVRANDHDNEHNENNEPSTTQNRDNQVHNEQNLMCFWIVGLCNGFGGTVMWSATFDVIKRLNGVSV